MHQHYFCHDLLIFGYDERKKTYRTAGFDERFNYGITDYLWDEVELAYGTMRNEWDYQFFAFSVVDAHEEYYDFPHIKSELQIYLQGKNPIPAQLDRVRGTHRHFLKIPCNEELGVNDIRSIHAVCGHMEILEFAISR